MNQTSLLRIASIATLAFASELIAKLPATNVEELFGGRENMAIVEHADSLEVCLLIPKGGEKAPAPRFLNEYVEFDKQSVPESSAKELISLLLKDDIYRWAAIKTGPNSYQIIKKGCTPFYHVRVKAKKSADTLSLSLCFYCSDIAVELNGKELNSAMLAQQSEKVLVLLRNLYPNDRLLANAKSHDIATP